MAYLTFDPYCPHPHADEVPLLTFALFAATFRPGDEDHPPTALAGSRLILLDVRGEALRAKAASTMKEENRRIAGKCPSKG